MRKVVFEVEAFRDFVEWASIDRRLYQRIANLIVDTLRTPFSGLGKPEPLKYTFKGCWSRRIDDKNRVIYKVSADEILIIACKGHYD